MRRSFMVSVFLVITLLLGSTGAENLRPRIDIKKPPIAVPKKEQGCKNRQVFIEGKCRDACLQSECNHGQKALWVQEKQACYCFGQDECINGDKDCTGRMICVNGTCQDPCKDLQCQGQERPVWKQNRGCACLGPNGCFDNEDCGPVAICENSKCNECPNGNRDCRGDTQCVDKRCRKSCSAGECAGNQDQVMCISGYCYDSWEEEFHR